MIFVALRQLTNFLVKMDMIEAKHMCMQMRGVEKQNSITTTSDYSGVFNSLNTRQEFMSLLRGESKRI